MRRPLVQMPHRGECSVVWSGWMPFCMEKMRVVAEKNCRECERRPKSMREVPDDTFRAL